MTKIRTLFESESIAFTMLVGAVLLAVAIAVGLADLASASRGIVMRDGSMEPTFSEGSLLVVQTVDAGTVRPGDVVAISTAAGTVTRRVLAVDRIDAGRLVSLKADAARGPEGWGAMFPGEADVVRLAVPLAGYLSDGWRVAAIGGIGLAGVALMSAGTLRLRRIRTTIVPPFPAIEPAPQIHAAL